MEFDLGDPTTTHTYAAPMQSLNQSPGVTDLADARPFGHRESSGEQLGGGGLGCSTAEQRGGVGSKGRGA